MRISVAERASRSCLSSATRAVWTGSENWSDVSLLNDELVVMIPRDRVHDAYVEHFDEVWGDHSKAVAPPTVPM